MQLVAYFAPIRQIWQELPGTCRVSGRSTFYQVFRCLDLQLKKAVDMGQDLGI
jgi:hypothetical protein